ncbi:hypothetical protein QWY96_20275 [Vibrio artabrorum]|uniref:Uncharacterized protein n=1 Tax=Vibrio artabrorum TaxID=446374 RepID=A0ABT8CPG2_9VIBR|nr:hypothetical protein [Vibrio artabrorum]MDN3702661.1 hypothetical protein [Vibrio artabrorum]
MTGFVHNRSRPGSGPTLGNVGQILTDLSAPNQADTLWGISVLHTPSAHLWT